MTLVGDLRVLPYLSKDENGKLLFNGEPVSEGGETLENADVLAKFSEDGSGNILYDGSPIVAEQSEGSGGSGVDVVSDYNSLSNSAAEGTVVCVKEKSYLGEAVTVNYFNEDEETDPSELSYVVNKDVTVNPAPAYKESAFEALIQYALDNPNYDYDTIWDNNATYDSSSGQRYFQEVSKETYEDVTETLSDGDSVYGLKVISDVEYEFDPYASMVESFDDEGTTFYANLIPVFTDSDNIFSQNDFDSENGYMVNENANYKYAIMVSSEGGQRPVVNLGNGRYSQSQGVIYFFESGTFTFDMDGNEITMSATKGWNSLDAILESNGDYMDMSGITVSPIAGDITKVFSLRTKSDGIAVSEDEGAAAFFNGLFVTDVVALDNGIYVRENGEWVCATSSASDTAKAALDLAEALSNNKALSALSDDNGIPKYNGVSIVSPIVELKPAETNIGYSPYEACTGLTYSDGDTTQYYQRSEWYGNRGNVSYLPVDNKYFSDGQDISDYYTRAPLYDYFVENNTVYNLVLPNSSSANVRVHLPDGSSLTSAGEITVYIYCQYSMPINWGRVYFTEDAIKNYVAGHMYMATAKYSPAIGRWTIDVIEHEQGTVSGSVPSTQTTLENLTWSEICAIADNGYYDDSTEKWCTGDDPDVISWFSVGDEKTIQLTDGTDITVQIAGFNHDNIGTGTKAGITFVLKNALPDKAFMNPGYYNKGSWAASDMRNNTIAGYYDLLPDSVKNAIQTVRKITIDGDYSRDCSVTYDKLFLLSYTEVFGNDTSEAVLYQEGKQYPVFTDYTSRVKNLGDDQNASPCWWRLRSPSYGGGYDFWGVGGYGSGGRYYANGLGGVVFGFCV